jgi:hypothetical protein
MASPGLASTELSEIGKAVLLLRKRRSVYRHGPQAGLSICMSID